MSDAVLVRDLHKEYTQGPNTLEVLKGVDVRVGTGEIACVMGPSGSGKSTLLNLVGGLDAPTRGDIEVGGRMVTEMSEEDLSEYRRHSVGFVFQSFNLVATLTAKQNVEMPLVFAGVPAAERDERATWALEKVGLADRMNHVPSELSGGEQQRVATARATINQPALILADEPTGNLDSATGAEILRLIREMNHSGQTFLIITHDREVAAWADRVVHLKDGLVVYEEAKGGHA